MFLATIKNCTDETYFVQRLFTSRDSAEKFIEGEIKSRLDYENKEGAYASWYRKDHPATFVTGQEGDTYFREDNDDAYTELRDSASLDSVVYFVREINPDDGSETEFG